jgi:hypothetical protein
MSTHIFASLLPEDSDDDAYARIFGQINRELEGSTVAHFDLNPILNNSFSTVCANPFAPAETEVIQADFIDSSGTSLLLP